MSEFIIGGIILMTTVNWLYSRFCENHSNWRDMAQGQVSRSKTQ